jgi:hypothetical protein
LVACGFTRFAFCPCAVTIFLARSPHLGFPLHFSSA